jgi:hypothetical protein
VRALRDEALFHEWDGGELDQAAGERLFEKIEVAVDPRDGTMPPGFFARGELEPEPLRVAWNRMLGIVRTVGEATARNELGVYRQLARDFYLQAVDAARETRAR